MNPAYELPLPEAVVASMRPGTKCRFFRLSVPLEVKGYLGVYDKWSYMLFMTPADKPIWGGYVTLETGQPVFHDPDYEGVGSPDVALRSAGYVVQSTN